MTAAFPEPDPFAPPAAAAWQPHPRFPGVAMRLLLGGTATGGAFSQHEVRVDAGREIGLHTHPGAWESHVVLTGRGRVEIAGEVRDYAPGTTAAMPPDVLHRVCADGEALYILATFVPALG
ncbi:Cupin 2 conserved barrel domain protein (fragment) [uncultured Alphaproteobacteria bacterium]|uniref:Cupin 2 conserved barrel domain protein n=1 Tax=uncultured Alphaproteobacteria bacterium TaxID=91750 RepID=A0A212KH67_9PROT